MDLNVSRSGRVRKKSSKLADFESSSDLDLIVAATMTTDASPVPPTSAKKKPKTPTTHMVMSTSQPADAAIAVDELPPDQLLADDQSPDTEPENSTRMDEELDVDIENIREEDFEDIPYVGDDDDDDDLLDDDVTGQTAGEVGGDSDDSSDGNLMIDDTKGARSKGQTKSGRPASIYLSEKLAATARKPAGQSGRVTAVRRDKGTRRITAFMLWAKQMRKSVVDSNPRMDFSAISKKLGEIWATVSSSEKDSWKRRAKRINVKEAGRKSAPSTTTTAAAARSQPSTHRGSRFGGSSPPSRSTNSHPLPSRETYSTSVHKAVQTGPLDAAAHLKLLGESLTVIGERLTEHEGQIAVSGSLSVLLDSLLCSLAPLICLTQQVPELNVVPPETLSRTLDNIAYIMPGL